MYLVIYIHGTKRIRSPTSYSAKQESFALYKRGAHSELRPCTATHIRGLFFPRYPAYTDAYSTGRSLFMSERFSYQRFIESENAIVAVKWAKTFRSLACGDSLYMDSSPWYFKPDHNGIRVTRLAGHWPHFAHPHPENSRRVPTSERIAFIGIVAKVSRSCIEIGYVIGTIVCYIVFDMHQHLNTYATMFSFNEDSIAFSFHLIFLSRVMLHRLAI